MKPLIRVAGALVLLAALTALVALPALAQEDGETPTETTTQVLPENTIQPAVEVTEPPPDVSQADWTYRYMIPTALILGLLVIIVTTAQYFTSVVRKRYRIVEE